MTLFQDVVSLGLEEYKELPKNESPVPVSSLRDDFLKLFEDSINCGSASPDSFVVLDGSKIFFHKQFFACIYPVFANLAPKAVEEDLTEALSLKVSSITPDAFTSLLRHIYYGENSFTPTNACNLAPYCAKHQMAELQKITEGNISSNINDSNVLSILRVAYLPENAQRQDMKALRTNGVQYVLSHVSSVDLDPLRTMDHVIVVDILKAWQSSK